MRDDLWTHNDQVEADLAARHAKEERIRAVLDVATASRRDLAQRRKVLMAATTAALLADVQRDRVCHPRNKQ